MYFLRQLNCGRRYIGTHKKNNIEQIMLWKISQKLLTTILLVIVTLLPYYYDLLGVSFFIAMLFLGMFFILFILFLTKLVVTLLKLTIKMNLAKI